MDFVALGEARVEMKGNGLDQASDHLPVSNRASADHEKAVRQLPADPRLDRSALPNPAEEPLQSFRVVARKKGSARIVRKQGTPPHALD